MDKDRLDDEMLARILGEDLGGAPFDLESAISDAELSGFAEALAGYALAVTPDAELPEGMRSRVLGAVALEAKKSVGGVDSALEPHFESESDSGSKLAWGNLIPWALAACLTVVLGVTLRHASDLGGKVKEAEEKAAELAAELDGVKAEKTTITVLDPKVEGILGHGVAVFDSVTQQVTLQIFDLPPLDPAVSDYQLWIVDPQYEVPVDGGIFQVSKDGSVTHRFQAPLRVDKVAVFAVTKEIVGGVEVSAGPHLLLGAAE